VSHKGLVEVLKTGTPEEFRCAMRKHLENHFKRILERTFE
jgi:GntR family transcriptional regulator, transcriptional repressor for pyruvate dehydrogenase complex